MRKFKSYAATSPTLPNTAARQRWRARRREGRLVPEREIAIRRKARWRLSRDPTRVRWRGEARMNFARDDLKQHARGEAIR